MNLWSIWTASEGNTNRTSEVMVYLQSTINKFEIQVSTTCDFTTCFFLEAPFRYLRAATFFSSPYQQTRWTPRTTCNRIKDSKEKQVGSTSKLRWSLKTEHDNTPKNIFPGRFVFEPQERCLFWSSTEFPPGVSSMALLRQAVRSVAQVQNGRDGIFW